MPPLGPLHRLVAEDEGSLTFRWDIFDLAALGLEERGREQSLYLEEIGSAGLALSERALLVISSLGDFSIGGRLTRGKQKASLVVCSTASIYISTHSRRLASYDRAAGFLCHRRQFDHLGLTQLRSQRSRCSERITFQLDGLLSLAISLIFPDPPVTLLVHCAHAIELHFFAVHFLESLAVKHRRVTGRSEVAKGALQG